MIPNAKFSVPLPRVPSRLPGLSIALLFAALVLADTAPVTQAAPHASRPTASLAGTPDQTQLLAGVTTIASPGVPGPLCVYGDSAFAVVAGGAGGANRAPAVVASRLGLGRVVALGHNGYFGKGALETADTGRLLQNAVAWASGNIAKPIVAVVGKPETAAYLKAAGLAVDEVAVTGLAGHAVAILELWSNPQSEVDAVAAFVQKGGGLITASTGWGWEQLNPGKDLRTEHPGNRLLAAAGIQYTGEYLDQTSPGGFAAGGAPSDFLHAGRALQAAVDHDANRKRLLAADLAQVSETLVLAATCVPGDDTLFLPKLQAATDRIIVPTPKNPVKLDEVIDRLAVVLQTREFDGLPLDQAMPHPAALVFPGAVPADAPRVTRGLRVNTAVPDWHSSGLYAPPGEVITLTLPTSAAGKGLVVRIGAHTDALWSLDAWPRMPEVSRAWPLAAATTRVFSPYGGLIYLVVPRNSTLGTLQVTVAGAVEAPLFLSGETDPGDWTRLRQAPAPWAEIGSGKMVVAVPSDRVRSLADPAALAATWDRVLDLDAELAGIPAERARAERFVTDEEISAGYMHSGYPLMCHLDQADNLVSRRNLLEGNWGFFHEVGHNHQSGDWTFDGTGEVTVNLFTLYVTEFLSGKPPLTHDRGSEQFVRDEMKTYSFQQPDFQQWKDDPFLALTMYVQLQHAFGWAPFRQVFAEYRALPDAERPMNDAQKRDQWMLRFSRTVCRNLGPFFEAWGIPTSAAARQSIAGLPKWLPEGFPTSYRAVPAKACGADVGTATATATASAVATSMMTSTARAVPTGTSTSELVGTPVPEPTRTSTSWPTPTVHVSAEPTATATPTGGVSATPTIEAVKQAVYLPVVWGK